MPITIDGTGSISGLSAGGLPDLSVQAADLVDGAVTQAKRSEDLTRATAQASTSGTVVDFTGIPSWVRRITVMFSGVSTTGTSAVQVQLGTSSGIESTGYLGSSGAQNTGGAAAGLATTGTVFNFSSGDTSAAVRHGSLSITNVSGNVWTASGALGLSNTAFACYAASSKTLAAVLDRIRITTVNGTDTFDAGSINIMYE